MSRRIAWPIAVTAALACALLLALFPCRSDDIFMHLAVGRRFFQTGHLPDPDPWLFSIPNYERGWTDVWGSHLGAYVLYRLGGWNALVLGKTALVVAGAAAPLWLARRADRRTALAPALVLLACAAASERFLERSSLVSDVAGAWVLAIACADRLHHTRARLALPALFLVWTNIHFGVLVALGLLAADAATRPAAWRRTLPILAASTIACAVHPDGPAHLLFAIKGVLGGGFNVYREHYFEFMPTFSAAYRDSLQTRLFCALLAAIALLLVRAFHRSARRGARPWFHLLAFLALALTGASAIRFVSTAALALAVLGVAIEADSRLETPPNPTWNYLPAAVALALCARIAVSGYPATSGTRHLGLGLDESVFPIRAARFLGDLPPVGGIFNEHSFGAFLAWQWDGSPSLYYHGYVLAPEFYERDYLGASRSPADFDRIVARYDLGAFFLATLPVTVESGPLLHRLLITRPEWHLVYWDPRAMIFLRDTASNRPLIEQFEYRYLDPFRPERIDLGARTAPERLRAEARRALEDAPDNALAKKVLSLL